MAPVLAGRYRLEGVLGQGGMGTVYRAEHLGTGRKVAVKVLAAELAKDPIFVQRFQQEARASVAIDHPGVVDVFDTGVAEDGSAFMVMELLRGETLGARLLRPDRLSVEDVVWIGSEALTALAAAHAKGVLHRDLKPDNLFLVSEPARAVKIVDFGISKLQSAANPNLTHTGMVMGTPTYMAPEQARGAKNLGPAADLYSMGVILYHALAGQPPFTGESLGEVMAKVLTEPFRPLAATRGDLPVELTRVVESLLAKDPAKRPSDASSVREALVAALPKVGLPTAATVMQPATTRRIRAASEPRTRKVIIASVAGLLVVGLVGWKLLANRGDPAHHPAADAKSDGKDASHPAASTASVSKPGDEFDQPISGLRYVLVSRGSFTPGCLDAASCGATPTKESGAFWVGKSLVSVKDYQVCVDGHRCRSLAKRQEGGALRRCNAEAARLDYPANCVTYSEAQSFCHWAGEGRLPTALEWEYAARSNGRAQPYPWGDSAPTGKRANFCDRNCAPAPSPSGAPTATPLRSEDDGYAFTAPVNSYPKGATDTGLLDMAGNVYQWTGTEARAESEGPGDDVLGALRNVVEGGGGAREVRGGSYESPPEALRTIASSSRDAQKWGPDLGFRCVLPLRSK